MLDLDVLVVGWGGLLRDRDMLLIFAVSVSVIEEAISEVTFVELPDG
jgi:hypothetical protein